MQEEIEVKIKLDSKQMELLKSWLSKNSKDLGETEITDYYLNNPQCNFYQISKKGFKDPIEFLRVRKTQDRSFVCYKKRTIDESGYTVQVEEFDLEVSNGVNFLSF